MIRSLLYRRSFQSILASCAITALTVLVTGEVIFTQAYEGILDSGYADALNRLDIYDTLIAKLEDEARDRGEAALGLIAARPDHRKADMTTLDAWAAELGVSEIYIINARLVVESSSLATDIGLDFGAMQNGVTDFFEELLGSGKLVSPPATLSALTGAVNFYQYYSPQGADYIIEVSSSINDIAIRSFRGKSYLDLVSLAMSGPSETRLVAPPARLVDILLYPPLDEKDMDMSYSLFYGPKDVSRVADLLAEAKEGGTASRLEGDKKLAVYRVKRWKSPYFNDERYYALIEMDCAPFSRFRLFSLVFALVSVLASTLVIFIITRASYVKHIAKPLEALEKAMLDMARGDPIPERPADRGGPSDQDEIESIAQGIESMALSLRQTETRLHQSQKLEALGIMASGIAHDFNNVLGSILGNASLLEDETGSGDIDPEEFGLRTTAIIEAARKGRDIVMKLLDYARQEKRRDEPVSLGRLVEETAEMARAQCPPGVDVEVSIDYPEAAIRGDPTDLGRALFNICLNGIQAMRTKAEAGARLRLRVSLQKREGPTGAALWAIEVSDEGTGIEPDMIAKLFTPFFSTKTGSGGSGLGLANALAMAERHEGTIKAESRVGEGSTFTILLPRA